MLNEGSNFVSVEALKKAIATFSIKLLNMQEQLNNASRRRGFYDEIQEQIDILDKIVDRTYSWVLIGKELQPKGTIFTLDVNNDDGGLHINNKGISLTGNFSNYQHSVDETNWLIPVCHIKEEYSKQSDINDYISAYLYLLKFKVDKEYNKGLTTVDFDDYYFSSIRAIPAKIDGKIDKEVGKELSTHDFSEYYVKQTNRIIDFIAYWKIYKDTLMENVPLDSVYFQAKNQITLSSLAVTKQNSIYGLDRYDVMNVVEFKRYALDELIITSIQYLDDWYNTQALQLILKEDKVKGLGLSTNDFTYDHRVIVENVQNMLALKVDNVEGKQLSMVDFTPTYKTKLDSIDVNIGGGWSIVHDEYIDTYPDANYISLQTCNKVSLITPEVKTHTPLIDWKREPNLDKIPTILDIKNYPENIWEYQSGMLFFQKWYDLLNLEMNDSVLLRISESSHYLKIATEPYCGMFYNVSQPVSNPDSLGRVDYIKAHSPWHTLLPSTISIREDCETWDMPAMQFKLYGHGGIYETYKDTMYLSGERVYLNAESLTIETPVLKKTTPMNVHYSSQTGLSAEDVFWFSTRWIDDGTGRILPKLVVPVFQIVANEKIEIAIPNDTTLTLTKDGIMLTNAMDADQSEVAMQQYEYLDQYYVPTVAYYVSQFHWKHNTTTGGYSTAYNNPMDRIILHPSVGFLVALTMSGDPFFGPDQIQPLGELYLTDKVSAFPNDFHYFWMRFGINSISFSNIEDKSGIPDLYLSAARDKLTNAMDGHYKEPFTLCLRQKILSLNEDGGVSLDYTEDIYNDNIVTSGSIKKMLAYGIYPNNKEIDTGNMFLNKPIYRRTMSLANGITTFTFPESIDYVLDCSVSITQHANKQEVIYLSKGMDVDNETGFNYIMTTEAGENVFQLIYGDTFNKNKQDLTVNIIIQYTKSTPHGTMA